MEAHSWIGVAAAGLVLIHLLLHWRWIIEITKRAKSYIKMGLKAITERYATAVILFVLFLFQVFFGCIIWLILPRGAGDYNAMIAGVGRTFWGLQRNVWLDLHAWIAVAMAAIIIIHIIMHWRWIVNITLGKRRAGKAGGEVKPEKVPGTDKPVGTTESGQPSYLPRVGIFAGLFGAICFLVLMAIYQLDWVGRYDFMLYIIPLPFISLLVARKWPFIGGVLLIVSGIVAVLLDVNYTIGVPFWIVGPGIGYTLVFVTLPLLVSGVLFILSRRKEL